MSAPRCVCLDLCAPMCVSRCLCVTNSINIIVFSNKNNIIYSKNVALQGFAKLEN